MTYTATARVVYFLAMGKRRALVVWGLLTVAGACSALERDGGNAVGRRRPNVILVMTDDQGYGDLGAHGNAMIRTPHMDRLHEVSVRLTDFHVDPTCSPTRSALMTGRYSTRTGVWHTIAGRSLLDPNEETLGELFRENGYRTGMFGKWHLGDNYPLRPQDQGFEHAVWHHGGGIGQGPDYWGNDYFDDTYEVNGRWQEFEGYCTDVWFEEARKFIEAEDERPFFAYIATNAPHDPYNVDEAYSKPYEELGVAARMSRFYGMITNIDENLGELRGRLVELGIARDTLLIFMTDNGTSGGHQVRKGEEASWPGFRAGMRAAKGSEYDGGHRVPCFFYWPGGGIGEVHGARSLDALAAHIDLFPTLSELCGLERRGARPLDGVSLAAALRGRSSAPTERTLFVHSQRVARPLMWRKSAVMTEGWRLVNGTELFDLERDPGQEVDVAAEHPDTVAELRGQYERWWQSLEPVFDQRVRIGLGGAENPTRLMSHDWHPDGNGLPWHQGHVLKGAVAMGVWAVEVERAGEYEIHLFRWPEHLDRSMGMIGAEVRIGEVAVRVELQAGATEAVLRTRLPAGPAELRGTLHRPDGQEQGAYYASVRYIAG